MYEVNSVSSSSAHDPEADTGTVFASFVAGVTADPDGTTTELVRRKQTLSCAEHSM
ncbi:hypothetical protein Sliba_76930 [Streptomyces nigrescens]|uniref:Uncharacterized protein n=1 Tax=Streptomyces nigrescens TaxID=1920 RepID=A0A640TVP6_STRNI|nr:hypothetical protein Sliba_76930 [Streptomyces libani subsp. libani]GGV96680.1 hypothetical protein GCM10010500_40140 [Streptomyces libani subsp. libani]